MWAREARKFGVASREARKFGWGSREARRQEMVCAGAREARLHEDVLEMKVLLAQNPPPNFLKARFARALRAYLAPSIS